MRIFRSAVEAVKEVERDLWEMGHNVVTQSVQDQVGEVKSKEIVGYSFTLLNGNDWPEVFGALGMGLGEISQCVGYVGSEYSERIEPLNPPNPGLSWTERSEVWKKFLHDGRFAYTYAERLQSRNQIRRVNQLTSLDPASRQLILQVYDQSKDSEGRGGHWRVPCTMYYQVLHRDGVDYLIHNMRSCDLYTHFPIDLSISWLLAQYFAQGGAPRLIMQFGSFHAFEKDLKPRGIF